jgi:hypothetical protein
MDSSANTPGHRGSDVRTVSSGIFHCGPQRRRPAAPADWFRVGCFTLAEADCGRLGQIASDCGRTRLGANQDRTESLYGGTVRNTFNAEGGTAILKQKPTLGPWRRQCTRCGIVAQGGAGTPGSFTSGGQQANTSRVLLGRTRSALAVYWHVAAGLQYRTAATSFAAPQRNSLTPVRSAQGADPLQIPTSESDIMSACLDDPHC